MRTNSRLTHLARRAAAFALGAALLIAAGCAESRTSEEVKRDYALKILEGFSVGYFDIRAERADPATFTLYNLTLKSGEALITADEAKIVVNAADDTVSLQLFGVVGADARTGVLMSLDSMNSGAVKLSGGVTD